MEILALLIALVALGLSLLALHRTGGIQDLRRQLDQTSCKPETIRGMIADALADLADRIRGKGRKSTDQDAYNSENQTSHP